MSLNKTMIALAFALAMTACTGERPIEQEYLECTLNGKITIKSDAYDDVGFNYSKKIWYMTNYNSLNADAIYLQQTSEFCEGKTYIEGVTHETQENQDVK